MITKKPASSKRGENVSKLCDNDFTHNSSNILLKTNFA